MNNSFEQLKTKNLNNHNKTKSNFNNDQNNSKNLYSNPKDNVYMTNSNNNNASYYSSVMSNHSYINNGSKNKSAINNNNSNTKSSSNNQKKSKNKGLNQNSQKSKERQQSFLFNQQKDIQEQKQKQKLYQRQRQKQSNSSILKHKKSPPPNPKLTQKQKQIRQAIQYRYQKSKLKNYKINFQFNYYQNLQNDQLQFFQGRNNGKGIKKNNAKTVQASTSFDQDWEIREIMDMQEQKKFKQKYNYLNLNQLRTVNLYDYHQRKTVLYRQNKQMERQREKQRQKESQKEKEKEKGKSNSKIIVLKNNKKKRQNSDSLIDFQRGSYISQTNNLNIHGDMRINIGSIGLNSNIQAPNTGSKNKNHHTKYFTQHSSSNLLNPQIPNGKYPTSVSTNNLIGMQNYFSNKHRSTSSNNNLNMNNLNLYIKSQRNYTSSANHYSNGQNSQHNLKLDFLKNYKGMTKPKSNSKSKILKTQHSNYQSQQQGIKDKKDKSNSNNLINISSSSVQKNLKSIKDIYLNALNSLANKNTVKTNNKVAGASKGNVEKQRSLIQIQHERNFTKNKGSKNQLNHQSQRQRQKQLKNYTKQNFYDRQNQTNGKFNNKKKNKNDQLNNLNISYLENQKNNYYSYVSSSRDQCQKYNISKPKTSNRKDTKQKLQKTLLISESNPTQWKSIMMKVQQKDRQILLAQGKGKKKKKIQYDDQDQQQEIQNSYNNLNKINQSHKLKYTFNLNLPKKYKDSQQNCLAQNDLQNQFHYISSNKNNQHQSKSNPKNKKKLKIQTKDLNNLSYSNNFGKNSHRSKLYPYSHREYTNISKNNKRNLKTEHSSNFIE